MLHFNELGSNYKLTIYSFKLKGTSIKLDIDYELIEVEMNLLHLN